MTNLYKKLFETFDTLSTSDIKNGQIGGIPSIYSVPAKDSVGITIDSLNNSRKIANQISLIHKNHGLSIMLDSSPNIDGFRTLAGRIKDQLAIAGIFKNDDLMQQKLAEIYAVKYTGINPTFQVYSEVGDAKKIALAVFNLGKKAGLEFKDPKVEDLLKTVLFSVFYNLNANKKEENKPAKIPEKAKPAQEPAAPAEPQLPPSPSLLQQPQAPLQAPEMPV